MIGVLGGMGPMATADFLKKLVDMTPVKRDCEHLSVIAQSLPQIPDRTNAILGKGPSPLPDLIKMANTLKTAGADFGVMPCNTAHHWFDDLVKNIDLEMLHIVDAVCDELQRRNPVLKTIGLLATPGTIGSGFYQKRLADIAYDCIVPDEAGIERVYEGIVALKAGDFTYGHDLLMTEVDSMRHQNISTIILGCTELPLVLTDPDIFIDSSQVLAKACVGKAREIELCSPQLTFVGVESKNISIELTSQQPI